MKAVGKSQEYEMVVARIENYFDEITNIRDRNCGRKGHHNRLAAEKSRIYHVLSDVTNQA
jgi:hypothetical protein